MASGTRKGLFKMMRMSKEEKEEFINGMFDTLKVQALQKVDKMPEEWDAWELRQYISDKASEVVWSGMKNARRKRKYNNTIQVKNL
jgi:hypothetical protein